MIKRKWAILLAEQLDKKKVTIYLSVKKKFSTRNSGLQHESPPPNHPVLASVGRPGWRAGGAGLPLGGSGSSSIPSDTSRDT